MSQLPESLKKIVDGVDGDVLAIGEVDSFEGGRTFDESVNRVVRQVGDLRENEKSESGSSRREIGC